MAKMLSAEANDLTVIDSSEARLSKLRSVADVVTITGNISSIATLKKAEVDKAGLFIAVNPVVSQDVNVVSAVLAKKLGCPKVCARIDDEEYVSYSNKYLFTEMGIDMMIYPEKSAANEITRKLVRATSGEFMDFVHGNLQISVYRLDGDSPLLDIGLLEFTGRMASSGQQMRVVAVSRDNQTIIPKADTKFKENDIVFIISSREGVKEIMDFLGKQDVEVKDAMILGGSEIGGFVAQDLSSKIDTVKVIEKDKERALELSEITDDNVVVVCGDGRNSDFLLEENIKDYDAFVAVTGNDEANILACVVAKRFGVARTVAEVENIEYMRLAEEMGVDEVINKKLITASKIFKMTLSNKVRFIRYISGTNAEVMEYIVTPGSPVTRKPLKELDFPKNAIIGGVIRGEESFIAVGDTLIEDYDKVVVFALPDSVKEVDYFFK